MSAASTKHNKTPNVLSEKTCLALHADAAAATEKGQCESACAIYKKILHLQPTDSKALLHLGHNAKWLGDPKTALKSLLLIPQDDQYYFDAQLNAGLIFMKIGHPDTAIRYLCSAIKTQPSSVIALASRAMAYAKIERYEKALLDLTKCIKLDPKRADIFYNRALVHRKLHDNENAIADYTRAIGCDNNHYKAYHNRAIALRDAKHFDDAINDFDKAITINKDLAEGYWNKALTLMRIEQYEDAWPLYEYRWRSPNFTSPKRHFDKPLWLGNECLDGKKILIHSEQGLGDSLQFCRYITLMRNLGCLIYLEVEKPLIRIMRALLPASCIFEKNACLPDFDFQCPMMSLPLAFKTEIETIPRKTPYLSACDSHKRLWKNQLGAKTKPRIGIVWQGNPAHVNDIKRSIAVETVIDYLSPDFEWFSLQKDVSTKDLNIIKSTPKLHHFGEEIGDFCSTAGLCDALDAVVSVDTSMAHLAGAIGKPVHILLSYNADARWHENRSDTPWYPTATLFRQNADNQWASPLAQSMESLSTQQNFCKNINFKTWRPA
ncbi:tetratricopeptide repeat-containing glycosyltransferase family protein [Alphaproteobacteria bacterium]|nr:tetratricopeptide repeat-containing glycosyltransferase family protein [Alphaproteobacteria bacterium]MDC1120302.1 tetratricopeptide repeat-containing glycosyltransferase family protein [Alphaproteobacteria bacterium]